MRVTEKRPKVIFAHVASFRSAFHRIERKHAKLLQFQEISIPFALMIHERPDGVAVVVMSVILEMAVDRPDSKT
ncbi:MAG: hypothetical protein BWY82_00937 [Verrucomicrobia bacterium ADurb.Bin474]|nr:MAG: hypothetical protein BWY82_00937 [Verrucomicrobia bacterium ADurb.Bin474]